MDKDKYLPLRFFFLLVLLVSLYLLSLKNYLLFHSLAELYSIVIAAGIFIIAWNARYYLDNDYLLFLGISYFFVAVVDTIHTLAYKGMGVFIGADANLPTQLWIIARYVESLSFLVAPFFIRHRLRVYRVLLFFTVIVSFFFLSVALEYFPACYIEGYGLTSFKKISEYIISLILLLSLYFLRQHREYFSRRVLNLVSWSIATTIFAELSFTLYLNVYGISNFIGHLLKILSFYLIYKAILETGLKKPYDLLWRRMKLNEKKLKEERDRIKKYLDIAGVILMIIGADGKVELINKKGAEVLGYEEKDILGKDWFDNFLPESVREEIRLIFNRIISGDLIPRSYAENAILTKSGEERLIAWHNTYLTDESGQIVATLSSGEDITERKNLEKQREDLIKKLEDALAEVKILSGILPMCASCKKIRDDQGRWVPLESYIRAHSEADFSHGICPACAKRLYGDVIE